MGKGPPPGCNGGDPWMIHTFMHKNKVPDETCLAYSAVNQECTALNVCRNCFRMVPPDPKDPFKPGPCWGEPTFIGYGVREYAKIKGEEAMMKEIYARGPISCSGVTTIAFVKDYANNPGVRKDGIFRDATKYNESDIDHQMEITGWGETAEGQKYWVIRNSWGTYWGLAGWFLLERGTNSLKIEEHCDWAVPDFDELDEDILHQVQGDYYKGVPGNSPNFGIQSLAKAEKELVATLDDTQSQKLLELLSTGLVGALVGGSLVWISQRISRTRRTLDQPSLLG